MDAGLNATDFEMQKIDMIHAGRSAEFCLGIITIEVFRLRALGTLRHLMLTHGAVRGVLYCASYKAMLKAFDNAHHVEWAELEGGGAAVDTTLTRIETCTSRALAVCHG